MFGRGKRAVAAIGAAIVLLGSSAGCSSAGHRHGPVYRHTVESKADVSVAVAAAVQKPDRAAVLQLFAKKIERINKIMVEIRAEQSLQPKSPDDALRWLNEQVAVVAAIAHGAGEHTGALRILGEDKLAHNLERLLASLREEAKTCLVTAKARWTAPSRR